MWRLATLRVLFKIHMALFIENLFIVFTCVATESFGYKLICSLLKMLRKSLEMMLLLSNIKWALFLCSVVAMPPPVSSATKGNRLVTKTWVQCLYFH